MATEVAEVMLLFAACCNSFEHQLKWRVAPERLMTMPHGSHALSVHDDDKVLCKRQHDSSSRLPDLPLIVILPVTSRASSQKLMLSVEN